MKLLQWWGRLGGPCDDDDDAREAAHRLNLQGQPVGGTEGTTGFSFCLHLCCGWWSSEVGMIIPCEWSMEIKKDEYESTSSYLFSLSCSGTCLRWSLTTNPPLQPPGQGPEKYNTLEAHGCFCPHVLLLPPISFMRKSGLPPLTLPQHAGCPSTSISSFEASGG